MHAPWTGDTVLFLIGLDAQLCTEWQSGLDIACSPSVACLCAQEWWRTTPPDPENPCPHLQVLWGNINEFSWLLLAVEGAQPVSLGTKFQFLIFRLLFACGGLFACLELNIVFSAQLQGFLVVLLDVVLSLFFCSADLVRRRRTSLRVHILWTLIKQEAR